jgi:FtsP/CotA-like multicopper oxidase with cupredoxin domain
MFITLFQVLLCIVVTRAAVLSELTYIESSDGVLATTLTVNKYFYENSETSVGFWTRLYNPPTASGNILHPGPVLKFKRGDLVNVTLMNALGPETGSYITMNSYHYANTTNLHTHGLHVSAESPQDNVLMTVSPGSSYTYSYRIPDDHAAGTFWYHAHHHGSTAIQVGGGMLGAIIVADDESEVPSAIYGMPELVLLLSEVPFDDLLKIYTAVSGDDLLGSRDNYAPNGYSAVLVNGQYQPTASMIQGKWTRLRVIFSGLTHAIELQMTNNTISCEWYLLAKDGIFVNNAPREFGDTIYLAPGNRADVVVRCDHSGSFTVGSTTGPTAQETILTVTVAASTAKPDEDLPRFTPYRPNYLADVYTQSGTAFSLEFSRADGGCSLNNVAWDGSTAAGSMVSLVLA